jgi:hypothetical protein
MSQPECLDDRYHPEKLTSVRFNDEMPRESPSPSYTNPLMLSVFRTAIGLFSSGNSATAR